MGMVGINTVGTLVIMKIDTAKKTKSLPSHDVARQGVGPFEDVAEAERNNRRPSPAVEESKNLAKSIDDVVHTSSSDTISVKEVKEACVGEVLAVSYLLNFNDGYVSMQDYGVVSSKPHYKSSYSESISKNDDEAVVVSHSPVVLNEISYEQAGQSEQVQARKKHEFGKIVVQEEPDLVAKEQQYWWKMNNKAFKELIYATSNVMTWFVN